MAAFDNGSHLPIHTVTPPQASVLDFVFPGSTRILAAVGQLQAGHLNSYASFLCVFAIGVFLVKHGLRYLRDFVEAYLTSHVHVTPTSEGHDMLTTWASTQPLTSNVRSSLLRVGMTYRNKPQDTKKSLSYRPWKGTCYFFYKGHLLWYRSEEIDTGYRPEERVSVSCLSRNPRTVKMFLEECRSMYLELTQNKTTVFEPGGKSWKKVKARDIRDISTVIIKAEVKSKLLKDFKAFLDPDTRLWYWERGIPYQRGYLLYGPPGTGKTSLSACLAGCGRLDIYVLSLSSTNEQALNALFNELPSHCVLLLEDVDAVVTTQARQAEDASDDDKTDSGKEGKQKAKGGISLSALLNALDGVSAPEGRVLAMTTNHPERLDPALIRPGRVDLKIELGFADREIIVNLFRFIYKSPGAKAGEDPEFEKVAAAFADKMPDKEFTAAEIMSHLVENRLSPGGALANAEAWITRTREERMKSKRVGSWALNG